MLFDQPTNRSFAHEVWRQNNNVIAEATDRDYFEPTDGSRPLKIRFHGFRLTSETAATADGADAVCVFVNDQLDAKCLKQLSQLGIKLIALRCAGFNNVDLTAAK